MRMLQINMTHALNTLSSLRTRFNGIYAYTVGTNDLRGGIAMSPLRSLICGFIIHRTVLLMPSPAFKDHLGLPHVLTFRDLFPKSLVFTNENHEIRDRFEVKIFFLENLCLGRIM